MKKLLTLLTLFLGVTMTEANAANHAEVTIETNKGSFVLQMREDKAPVHVQNFLDLVADDFYTDIIWHRVIPGFVAQVGDPRTVGREEPDINLELEISDLKHTRGALGMARTAVPNSAGTQFYICYDDTPHLDGQYTVWGSVISGMDVVDTLEEGDKIVKATITKQGE